MRPGSGRRPVGGRARSRRRLAASRRTNACHSAGNEGNMAHWNNSNNNNNNKTRTKEKKNKRKEEEEEEEKLSRRSGGIRNEDVPLIAKRPTRLKQTGNVENANKYIEIERRYL